MNQTTPSTDRILSVDALRGFDMFWIVGGNSVVLAFIGLFVHPIPKWLNDQFTHPDWIGISAWDLIMPTFLFIVGTSMPLAFARRTEPGQSRAQLHLKIIRRTVTLAILGMVVSGNLLTFDLARIHVGSNTLEAIACGYLVGSIILLNLPVAGQVITVVILLVSYWLLMAFVPVPGRGPGVIEPNANVAWAVDNFFFGRFSDEEPYTGILTIMGYAATVLMGAQAGHLLRSGIRPAGKIAVLALAGLGCVLGGLFWSTCLGFPIIKHIWTSSYALWAAGWSFLLLAVFYAVIDVAGFRRWAHPFVVIGMNAITVYVAFHLISFRSIAHTLVGGLAHHVGAFGPFLLALATFMLVWLILLHMYRHNIFLRI
jgi:predicted acyltransferase